MSYSGNVNDKVENFKEGDLARKCLISRTTTNGYPEVQPHTERLLSGYLPSTVESALDWGRPYHQFLNRHPFVISPCSHDCFESTCLLCCY